MTNPYEAGVARRNLSEFLSIPRGDAPRVLYVGEAPGHRGALISGVPFAAVSTLTTDWTDPWGAFGPTERFEIPEECPHFREATATAFWNTVASCLPDLALPLTWNAVPFHPSQAGASRNATPTATQLLSGGEWLELVISDLAPDKIVAVGGRADAALEKLGHDRTKVRHPSHGGNAEFRQGLLELRAELGLANRAL